MVDITARTHLGRRLKPSDSQNVHTILLRLVFKQGVETVYGNVFESLRKVMVLHHVACGERFKTDGVILRYQVMRNLVEKIIPLIGNSFMRPCEFEPCTFPVLRTFGFLGERTLQTLNLLDRAFQIFVVLYFRFVRKNGKHLDAEVNTNRFAFADWLCLRIFLVYLNEYGNIVFVCRCPCDNGCLDKTLKLSVEASLNPFSEFGNIDPAFIEFYSRILRYGKTLPVVFLRLELRKTFLFTKELNESRVKIGKRHLQRSRINLRKPAIFLGFLHLRQFFLDFIPRYISSVFLIGFHLLVKSIVIDEATATKMLCNKHLLLLSRIYSIFICSVLHNANIQTFYETNNKF